jgi:hypothetical protein
MTACGPGAVIFSLSAFSEDSGLKACPKPIENDGVRPGRRHFLLGRGVWATPDRNTPKPTVHNGTHEIPTKSPNSSKLH